MSLYYALSIMKQSSTLVNYALKNSDCVILADGDFPTHEVPLSILKGCRYLCCCDHAAVEAMHRGYHVDAIVGDGDSLPEAFKAEHRDILHIVSEQDDNDMTKATRFCVAKGFRNIDYLGCTGKREDHTLGNISLLLDYRKDFHINVRMLTDHGIFITGQGKQTFHTEPGQQISIFNKSCSRLVGEGLRWQLRPFDNLWQGTLNEALGDEITINGNDEYLIYFQYTD